MRLFLLFGSIAVIVAAVCLSPTLFHLEVSTAQESTAISQPDPPATIDGEKTPELIPDDVAYTLLFRAIAEPENATEEENTRARAKISPAGLSEQDTVVFLNAVAEFQKQISALDLQAAEIHQQNPPIQTASSESQQLQQLNLQKDQIVTSTIATLQYQLTTDGMQKLYKHLQLAKQGMKIYPD